MVSGTFPVENMSAPLTPIRILGINAMAQIAGAVAMHLNAKRLLVVCDDNTWQAAGEQSCALLAHSCELEALTLGRQVRPTLALAMDVAARAADVDALIAIGSGTLNDVTKYAAAKANKPYAVIATAASMNGYTSANASLEEDDHKHSFPARPPVFVLGDAVILSNAPKRLMRAGLGDTLCRSTVEADMLLSHYMFGTSYPRALFDNLRRHEAVLLNGAMSALHDDALFLSTLFEALLDAGDAMTAHGSSAPASQGEHMIAHTLELKYGSELHNIMHGEMIAVTAITMSQLQQRALLEAPVVRPLSYEVARFEQLFGKRHGEALAHEYAKKLLTAEQAEAINKKVGESWEEIRQSLEDIMVPEHTLERAFIHSGMATKPSQLGIDDERYRFAASYAHLTRDRFTFLDVAAMSVKRMR